MPTSGQKTDPSTARFNFLLLLPGSAIRKKIRTTTTTVNLTLFGFYFYGKLSENSNQTLAPTFAVNVIKSSSSESESIKQKRVCRHKNDEWRSVFGGVVKLAK